MSGIDAGGYTKPPLAIFAQVNHATTMSYYGAFAVGRLVGYMHKALSTFHVPSDFHSIVKAVIVVIPRMTNAAAMWAILCNYAKEGEAYNTHQESNLLGTYNVTDDQIYEVDVSGILTGIEARDYVGMQLTLLDVNHDVDVLGVWIKYD